MTDKNEENEGPPQQREGIKQNQITQLIETIKSLEFMINSQCKLLSKVKSNKEDKDKKRMPSITGLERVTNVQQHERVSSHSHMCIHGSLQV